MRCCRTAVSGWRATRCRARCVCWRNCRGTRPGRSCVGNCRRCSRSASVGRGGSIPRRSKRRRQAVDLYIDTANLDEIRNAADLGVLDGVTTNPSLIAKEGVDYVKRLAEICEVVKGPVSAEVIATDYEGMVREGRERAKIAGNIVVKLPSTIAGLKACKTLTDEGTRTNMTLCFQTLQALMVAKAGAFLVSPFIGRLDDVATDGMDLIRQIRQVYDNYGFGTKILAASIRHPLHMVQCALSGADVATVPYKVIEQVMQHPLTDSGLEKFVADYRKAFG
ncbi:MAG TPA: fructose-6-phosphate aldolase [Phycisphaerales bacterium]|nr:fructose-6-phosphate aldolase [Phycisphaerales bacterium]